jgi:hypothetical protein
MAKQNKKNNNNDKWFEAGKPLNWSKKDSQTKRRRSALAARNNRYLDTARALQALANITTDTETERKARADAKYFFAKHKVQKLKAAR